MKAATASRQSSAHRTVAVGSGHLELQILIVLVVLVVLVVPVVVAGLPVGLGTVEGARAQMPWQELGPASTAN